ncbi:MAG: caspase family protein, partial [Candidatus Brocadiae bacterium]|nr:caspase family protein [Candidatus Brocadiia bacterium]
MGRVRTATSIVAIGTFCLLLLPSALAEYYFYGVADDQFTGDNDTLWAALEPYPEWDASRATLRDNWDADDGVGGDGRDSIYDDLLWYGDNLSSGDFFLFAYAGHGGWYATDTDGDEGLISRPVLNDPTPSSAAPYRWDEYFGYSGSTYHMRDDHLRDAMAGFDPCVTTVVISGACHAGGWVGGSHDLDTSAPATNNGLYALLGVPEQGLGIAVGPSGGPYEILLITALSNTIQAGMRM